MNRFAWHASVAWRATRIAAATALVVGVLIRVVLPVEDAWLAAVVAAGCATVALLLVLLESNQRIPSPVLVDAAAALETMGTAGQLAQAFGRSAVVLAGFALGLAVAELTGLGRA